ncbi:MAG: DinB family protein [candidate division KSB1 bacterium]|nr:DinB family protein [candidate division KSB1 bacterium]MDZ7311217.1 DinB family protein [candidate division KSB1 bacterium]
MAHEIDFRTAILNAWKTTNRTTVFLIENIPAELWHVKIPGLPRRTIGMIACHLHNSRCSWIKQIGKGQAIKMPVRVDHHRVRQNEVIRALNHSSEAMLKLLDATMDNNGKLPTTPGWLNFPNDVAHFLAYFVAHEAHHRGQIIMLARQLDHRFSTEVTNGLWHWTRRLREAK